MNAMVPQRGVTVLGMKGGRIKMAVRNFGVEEVRNATITATSEYSHPASWSLDESFYN